MDSVLTRCTAPRRRARFPATRPALDERPERCPLAPENRKVTVELREFLFGRRPNTFRVIFVIDGESVRNLRIRRGQRRLLSRREIDEAFGSEN
jgi:hypothetical protein